MTSDQGLSGRPTIIKSLLLAVVTLCIGVTLRGQVGYLLGLDLALTVGSVNQQVQVTGAAPEPRTQDSALAQTVSYQVIEALSGCRAINCLNAHYSILRRGPYLVW
jgi:hypothetical protein